MSNELISVTPSSDEWAVMKEQAKDLAASPLLPEALRGRWTGGKNNKVWNAFDSDVIVANLLLVADAARLYRQNFRAFAGECFVIGGRLDYSGKMYAAIFNSSDFCIEPLDFELSGEGENRTCYVSGWAKGMDGRRGFKVPIILARKNDPAPEWHNNPDQMLCYASARMWVRRFAFACTLGVTPPPDRMEQAMDIKEPGEEPLPKIEVVEQPETQRELASDTPSTEYIEYRERLQEAAGSRENIERVQRHAQGSKMGREELNRFNKEAGTMWLKCKSAEYDHWREFLKAEMEPDELIEYLGEIDQSVTLTEGEKNSLAKRCKPWLEVVRE